MPTLFKSFLVICFQLLAVCAFGDSFSGDTFIRDLPKGTILKTIHPVLHNLAYYQYTSFYPAEGQTTNNGYCYIDPIASHLPTRNNSETTVKMSQNFTLLRASKDTLIPNFTDLNLKYTSVQGTNYNIQMFCISQREITVADLNAYLGANLVVDLQSAEEILKDWQQAHTPVELR